jgi:hypothetical protein
LCVCVCKKEEGWSVVCYEFYDESGPKKMLFLMTLPFGI